MFGSVGPACEALIASEARIACSTGVSPLMVSGWNCFAPLYCCMASSGESNQMPSIMMQCT